MYSHSITPVLGCMWLRYWVLCILQAELALSGDSVAHEQSLHPWWGGRDGKLVGVPPNLMPARCLPLLPHQELCQIHLGRNKLNTWKKSSVILILHLTSTFNYAVIQYAGHNPALGCDDVTYNMKSLERLLPSLYSLWELKEMLSDAIQENRSLFVSAVILSSHLPWGCFSLSEPAAFLY